MHFLYKCRITIFNDSYTLNCSPLNVIDKSSKSLVFRGSEEGFKKFLKRVKASDSKTYPPSKRHTTYQQMIDDAKSGKHTYVYIWSEKIPKAAVITESSELRSVSTSFLESNLKAKDFIASKFMEIWENSNS